jgi:hypothetical protein
MEKKNLRQTEEGTEKEGYTNFLCVSKKGHEFHREDFLDATAKIAEALT